MPRRALLILLCLCLIWSSCARRKPQNADLRADAKLGAKQSQDDTEEAQRSLQEIQEKQLQEQKRQMERQITDPLVEREQPTTTAQP